MVCDKKYKINDKKYIIKEYLYDLKNNSNLAPRLNHDITKKLDESFISLRW